MRPLSATVFYDFPQLPAEYRGVWLINDWLRKTTFAYQPRWDGALLQPEGGRWQPFVSGGGAGRAAATYGGNRTAAAAGALYKPVDIVIGPEGALYVSGWGDQLGVVWGADGQQANEGRVFRISWPLAYPDHDTNTFTRNAPDSKAILSASSRVRNVRRHQAVSLSGKSDR